MTLVRVRWRQGWMLLLLLLGGPVLSLRLGWRHAECRGGQHDVLGVGVVVVR